MHFCKLRFVGSVSVGLLLFCYWFGFVIIFNKSLTQVAAAAPGAAPAPDASWVRASQALDYFYFVIDMFILLLLWFWDSFL